MRITGDCPLVDPDLLSQAIRLFRTLDVDYLSNCHPPLYPDGLDIEVFTKSALTLANLNCDSPSQREHVTPWMRDSGVLKIHSIQNDKDMSSMRWTVDEPEDLQLVREIVAHFSGSSEFSWVDVLRFHEQNQNYLKLILNIFAMKVLQCPKVKSYGAELSVSYQAEICFFLNDQRCFYQINGLHILLAQMAAEYGIRWL